MLIPNGNAGDNDLLSVGDGSWSDYSFGTGNKAPLAIGRLHVGKAAVGAILDCHPLVPPPRLIMPVVPGSLIPR